MNNSFRSFFRGEQGLEVVEYAVILGLIVAGVLITAAAIGTWVFTVFTDAQTAVGA